MCICVCVFVMCVCLCDMCVCVCVYVLMRGSTTMWLEKRKLHREKPRDPGSQVGTKPKHLEVSWKPLRLGFYRQSHGVRGDTKWLSKTT